MVIKVNQEDVVKQEDVKLDTELSPRPSDAWLPPLVPVLQLKVVHNSSPQIPMTAKVSQSCFQEKEIEMLLSRTMLDQQFEMIQNKGLMEFHRSPGWLAQILHFGQGYTKDHYLDMNEFLLAIKLNILACNAPLIDWDCWQVIEHVACPNTYFDDRFPTVKEGGIRYIRDWLLVANGCLHPANETPVMSLEDIVVSSRCGRIKVAHACYPNRYFGCINPKHFFLENKNTPAKRWGCKYGHAALCLHQPKCIWTSNYDGKYLLCRNQPLFHQICRCPDQSCLPPSLRQLHGL